MNHFFCSFVGPGRAMLAGLFCLLSAAAAPGAGAAPVFRAGAAAVDISPRKFPAIINGGFLQRLGEKVHDPLHVRCVVLDDGKTELAIAVVDSCMVPRELLDRAKELAHEKTGIPAERMLISSTHTHTAPSVMGTLGVPPDADYVKRLPGWIAEAIERAHHNLGPARVGWNVVDDPEHTHSRRWIRRPDKILEDPFGQKTARAHMHPGHQNPDAIAPAGPVDPGLTVLSLQSKDGRPIAVLANYSMHYHSWDPVSADYFGRFAAALAKRIGADDRAAERPFVGIMAQGTSGDQQWMDYARPKYDPGLDKFSDAVAASAERAYKKITYQDWAPLGMAETKIVLRRRVPDEKRLAWAHSIIDQMKGRELPKSLPEVYAREAVYLHEQPKRELKLQAIRIGDLGITAIPDEVYGITGLKLKAQSPFPTTMNIALANGAEGYIPTPEQHALGGYTTWPARTAGLEVLAEPKIVAAMLGLLEKVSGKPRRPMRVADCPYSRAVMESKPIAYWRLDDIEGTIARDRSGLHHDAQFTRGVAFYLPGADAPGLSDGKAINRAAHFAGGHLKANFENLPPEHTIELWFWNGLPNDARSTTGILYELGPVGRRFTGGRFVEELGLIGKGAAQGHLFVVRSWSRSLPSFPVINRSDAVIAPKTWHHVAAISEGHHLRTYLDTKPMINAMDQDFLLVKGAVSIFIGGSPGNSQGFEGKTDEVAIYDRALSDEEVAAHYRAAKGR